MNWYYAKEGKAVGPVEEKELIELARLGTLGPTDLVWNETMGQQWTCASNVPGLFPAQPPEPPPPAESFSGASPRQVSGVISCTAPVSMALQRMKIILFRPFDMGKWFVVGFTAWLATFGESGGGINPLGFNRNALSDFTKEGGGKKPFGWNEVMQFLDTAKAWVLGHWDLVLTIGISVVVVSVALGLLFLWLRCRGKFMLLDNVVCNRQSVSEPWREFAQHGNSLFWWTLVYSLVCLAVFAALAALAVYTIAIPCFKARAFPLPSVLPSIVVVGLLAVVFGIVSAYISRFLEDFIIPMMYRHNLTAREAWARFMPLLKASLGRLIVYGLFYLVLGILAACCILAAILITCCIAGCLMAIPYVGAVVLLPVTVFFRLYSIEYLAQYGPQFWTEPPA